VYKYLALISLSLFLISSLNAWPKPTPPSIPVKGCGERIPVSFKLKNEDRGLKTYQLASTPLLVGIKCHEKTETASELYQRLSGLGKVERIGDARDFFYEMDESKVSTRIYLLFKGDKVLNISFMSKKSELPKEDSTRKLVTFIASQTKKLK